MRVGIIAENILENLALKLGFVPTPLGETLFGSILVRTIMVGTKVGIFEALASSSLTAQDVARSCGIHPGATSKLLNALVGSKLLCVSGNCYSLSRVARKWLLKESPKSQYDSVLFGLVEAEIITRLEDFIYSGEPLNVHPDFDVSESSSEMRSLYQRGMCSRAKLSAGEVARRIILNKGASQMLDIGGSHGYYSVAICRRYPNLHAVILDLPSAVKQAAPILAEEKMGEQVIHWSGNALTEDLGEDKYDLVFISQLVHHFNESLNRALIQRVVRALRPGGTLVIQELIRREKPDQGGQFGALLDLFFALTSDAGTWTHQEMASWQRDAGLIPQKPIWLRTMPGVGQQIAMKPVKQQFKTLDLIQNLKSQIQNKSEVYK
ncbi:MAG: methyltransferase domain-containing protein [Cyanomargarita calcarea GSE-NOS-MK-12-04C]|jgi:predicted O-methyltransferase YrrM|uniref:Methyltransferase domain-containing protein n=1 Tax=Cyanomargarita calcarea GSE-NOS-MK-12-04C TaxID=2839659 RepID=A0A951UTZ6_9CYAN|nr:methyltransferase domain-containing protein [Cyanomargarita calcarea GSE-NOS-MK-12-04C]